MALGTFTLTASFDEIGGAAAAGKVRVDGIPQVIVDGAGNLITVGPKWVTLDAAGNMSIVLLTDATTGLSTTFGYSVTPFLNGLTPIDGIQFYARAAGSTVDLSDITTQKVESVGTSNANASAAAASATASATSATASAASAFAADLSADAAAISATTARGYALGSTDTFVAGRIGDPDSLTRAVLDPLIAAGGGGGGGGGGAVPTDASAITSGVFSVARLPAIDVTRLPAFNSTNLIRNPSVEDVTGSAAPHYVLSAATLTTSVGFRTGSQSAYCTLTTASAGDFFIANGTSLVPANHPKVRLGDTYRATAWVRTGNGAACNVNLRLKTRDVTGATAITGVVTPNILLTSTWTKLTIDMTITDSTSAYIYMMLSSPDNPAGATIRIDDMMLRQVFPEDLASAEESPQIAALDTRVTGLNTTVTSLSSSVSDLSGQASNYNTQVTSLAAQQSSLMATAASTEELSQSVIQEGRWVGTTYSSVLTNDGAQIIQSVWTAPFACKVVSLVMVCEFANQAASNTNYLTADIRKLGATSGTFTTVATKTTKSTGGEAIVARTLWSFDGASWDTAAAVLTKGQTLSIRWQVAGTATLTFPVVYTFRVVPS